MAKKSRNKPGGKKRAANNTISVETESFSKGLVKDLDELYIADGNYTHARNAVNNTKFGEIGIISNERSNELCAEAPYDIIGAIHLYEDVWTIYSTNDIDSEIGIFDESDCSYREVVNDQCLGFKRSNIITGESREAFDCGWRVYWSDGLNPDRRMDLDSPPYIQIPDPAGQSNPDCASTIDGPDLDCEALRMAKITTPPCLEIKMGLSGGELLNGTYQAVIAYTENGLKISDYSLPTNVVSIFDHRNVNGSIDIEIKSIDKDYEEFELVIVSFVNEKLVASSMGVYSTEQAFISIDAIPSNAITVPISLIPLDIPAYEKSEGIFNNGKHLIRVSPTTRFSFNYQPLANAIQTEWVSVEYPEDYYLKAGKNPSLLRDEVYPFFIRFVYNTNDKSDSYHIPGRAPISYTTPDGLTTFTEDDITNQASSVYDTEYNFEKYNTAVLLPLGSQTTVDDGGIIVGRGTMGYWQSSERYPTNKADIWGDLCGKPIRHHKMPDNIIDPHFTQVSGNAFVPDSRINVLGAQFKNIAYPVDLSGNPIPGIVGYEILRGSREGNKTILAKGMINNMGAYDREDTGQEALYQNYPYNDLRKDPFLSYPDYYVSGGDVNNSALGGGHLAALGGSKYRQDRFSFHSPDTQFKHPFLSAKEIKTYGIIWGVPNGRFVDSYLHPKHKVFTDFGFFVASMVGLGSAFIDMLGNRTSTYNNAISTTGDSLYSDVVGTGTNVTGLVGSTAAIGAANAAASVITGTTSALGGNQWESLTGLVGDSSAIHSTALAARSTAAGIAGALATVDGPSSSTYDTDGGTGQPGPIRIINGITTFLTNWSKGTDAFIRLVKAFSKFRQFGMSYESHCLYQRFDNGVLAGRYKIDEAVYVDDRLQEFMGNTINNLYRSGYVALGTGLIPNAVSSVAGQDTSRQTASTVFNSIPEMERNYETTVGVATSHYVALKSRLRNQYGQLEGIIQVPSSACMKEWEVDPNNPPNATSDVIFPGDTYIARYTEKNTFFFFSDWMYDEPDGFEYNYRLKKMIPNPTYWIDTRDYDVNTFVSGIFGSLQSSNPTQGGVIPSNFHNFDRGGAGNTDSINMRFMIKDAIFYLFSSGVRDFFVESEYNIAYRDWGESEEERHYDPYKHTEYSRLFRTDIIKSGNFYKYDYSLGVSRFYQAFNGTGWGYLQRRNYDPETAETCYSYFPNTLIYSLPQEQESNVDNWMVYLSNNFKTFLSKIVNIKSIGKNGAFMLFETEAPIQISGVDILKTENGTKVTLGDGGLFNQPLQNLVNTDRPYEYGSCQSRLSVVNTPAGLFWISQNQGKIFNYAGTLSDISQTNMKWWFDEYLPYKLTDEYPDFELKDNPVIGIGCQSIYDNQDGIIYFTKKDFKVKPEYADRVVYIGADNFTMDRAPIKLGDDRYFDDASWTISYDPKKKEWISFHDWHPELLLPGRRHFLSVKGNGMWTHNDRTDSFCNFYGTDYPFEIETLVSTGQTTNTLKSVEYMLEVYKWDDQGINKNHILDANFNRAIIYNTEQISGELRLNLKPKNNVRELLAYPIVTPNGIEILYSKEEQKYRFNQFWDITDDRGEFTNVRRMMWDTEPNGYIYDINPFYVNYDKDQLQRKKFRHYYNRVLLKRMVSGDNNLHMKLFNAKEQYSMR